MPKIKQSDKSTTYLTLRSASAAAGEMNDCGVVALAATTGLDYGTCHEALKRHGRKNRQGVNYGMIFAALEDLGFQFNTVDPQHFIQQYPGNHKNLKSVTSHHADRFKKVWADGHNYMVFVSGHVVGVCNGENVDWTKGRAMRARVIIRIER